MSSRDTDFAVSNEPESGGGADHPVRDELRRIASDTAFAVKLARGKVELPPATRADGPDPYGDPDPEWLRINWREHRHEVDVVGAKANYVEMGKGPPLLFVHGLSGCWQNWLENIPHFARSHRVVAVDLPGFGASPMPPWEISVPAYGRFLRDFCERIGIDRCSLVGNSMGGFIATELAITEPERIDDLTLISAAGITWAGARREPAAVIGRIGRAARSRVAQAPDLGDQAPEDAPGSASRASSSTHSGCGARSSGRTSSPRCRAPATTTR